MSRHLWAIEMFPYVERHDDVERVMAVCDNYAAAVGCAMRLMDVWGGWWRWDGYRGLWEEWDLPADEGERAQAVRLRRWRANRCDWERFDYNGECKGEWDLFLLPESEALSRDSQEQPDEG